MSDDTTTIKKAWTIRDAFLEDKQYVEALQVKQKFHTIGEALHHVVEVSKNTTTTTVSPEEITKLTELNQSLIEEKNGLQEKIESLRKEVSEERQIWNNLKKENATLTQEIGTLTERNQSLENKVMQMQDYVPSPTRFIVNTTPQLANRMRKARQFVRKKGIATGADYAGELATYAITQLLDENF